MNNNFTKREQIAKEIYTTSLANGISERLMSPHKDKTLAEFSVVEADLLLKALEATPPADLDSKRAEFMRVANEFKKPLLQNYSLAEVNMILHSRIEAFEILFNKLFPAP